MLLIELAFLCPKILKKFIERLLFQNPVELSPVITDQTDALHDNVIRAPPRRAQRKSIINLVFPAVLQGRLGIYLNIIVDSKFSEILDLGVAVFFQRPHIGMFQKIDEKRRKFSQAIVVPARVGTERTPRHFLKVKELLQDGPLVFPSLKQLFIAGQFWIA